MGKKRLGRICFLMSKISVQNQYVVDLINGLSSLIPNAIVIIEESKLDYAQTAFSNKVKLYTFPMCEIDKLGRLLRSMYKVIMPDIVFTLDNDQTIFELCRQMHMPRYIIKRGSSNKFDNDVFFCTNDVMLTSQFIVEYVENHCNIDCYTKFYPQMKAMNAQMTIREQLFALTHRKQNVETSFLNEWGYALPKIPHTYNEKLNWLKIYGTYGKYKKYADKQKARTVLKKMGYKSLLPKCYAVFNRYISRVAWEKFPDRFVVKPSNSSGYNIIVEEKSKVKLCEINRTLSCIKRVKYGLLKSEPVYKYFGTTIVTEYIEDPVDYKFYCFNGKVKFVAVSKELKKESNFAEPYQIIVDDNFRELSFTYGYERGTCVYDKPKYFEAMLKVVEDISRGVPHVRVDMMGTPERFYFGEFTFFPGGGRDKFNPIEYDRFFGDCLNL